MSDKKLKKTSKVHGPKIGVMLSRQVGDDKYGHTRVHISIEGIEIKKPGLEGIREGLKILLDEAGDHLQIGLDKAFEAKPKDQK